MTLKCVIIDDEPLALELMESYVRKTPFLELCGKYNSAVMALNDINFRNIDLLFLDIQMPDLNGLELSRMLPQDTRIVFPRLSTSMRWTASKSTLWIICSNLLTIMNS